MAKKKTGYVEPADYFPPDVRKKIEADLAAKAAKAAKTTKSSTSTTKAGSKPAAKKAAKK